MAENIIVDVQAAKDEKYKLLLPQIKALLQTETDIVANLANVAAALKQSFGFFWVGFYVKKEGELVLGPFQGPIACTRIAFGKGVCGMAYEQKATILVKNVEEFPGHIACSSESKSEIVVPVIKNHKVLMVLDIDSDREADFDETDRKYLEKLAVIVAESIN